jgi:hypothetical protein
MNPPARLVLGPTRGPTLISRCIALALVLSACQPRPQAEPPDTGSVAVNSGEGTDSASRGPADTAVALADSAASAVVPAAAPPALPTPPLSPLADSIAQYVVFDPTVQTWFLAAKRGKSLVVDIGRLDLDLGHDPHRRGPAYTEAVKALSPVRIGTPLRVYHAWGAEDDTVVGFDSWRGRIVAIVHTSKHLDSLMRKVGTMYAAAQRTDTLRAVSDTDSARRSASDSAGRTQSPSAASAAGASVPVASGPNNSKSGSTGAAGEKGGGSSATRGVPTDTLPQRDSAALADTCRHDTLSTDLRARAAAVRDSIDLWLQGLPPPPYPRLQSSIRSQSTQVTGCFGGANRLAMVVDRRAGNNEWIRERAVLLDTLGRVTTLRVIDYRLKGHDFLGVLDATGAGVDGIVARGVTEAAGETVILTLGPGNRLTRLTGGFAWENR